MSREAVWVEVNLTEDEERYNVTLNAIMFQMYSKFFRANKTLTWLVLY